MAEASKKKKKKPGAGRPKQFEIKKEDFESFCSIQCTKAEMAQILKCSTSTIEKWCKKEYGENYSNVYKRYSGFGKMSLRRAMFRNACKNNNSSIQIWLSKQHLGMRDQHEVDVNIKPFIVEAPDGSEVIKLGVDTIPELTGDTIDAEVIDKAEKNYYDSDQIDKDVNDEPTEDQQD